MSSAVQVLVLPEESRANSITFVLPIPTFAPAGGYCVTTTGLQLSVATTWPVRSGTVAWSSPPAGIVALAAHVVMAGGVISPEATVRQRVRAMLQLVEDEFRFYGPTVALRRLPRTSCYFAKFLPNYAEFRVEVRKVRNLADFRRLAKEFTS